MAEECAVPIIPEMRRDDFSACLAQLWSTCESLPHRLGCCKSLLSSGPNALLMIGERTALKRIVSGFDLCGPFSRIRFPCYLILMPLLTSKQCSSTSRE